MAVRSGWYVCETKKFPMGSGRCIFCAKAPQVNDVVYAKRISVNLPYRGYSYASSDRTEKIVIMHKDCMSVYIDKAPTAPIDVWESIHERLSAGGGLFDD